MTKHSTPNPQPQVTPAAPPRGASEIRTALQQAADALLDGQVPGPLTSTRLVELAGVKRHRLTHDNPDINADFQQRARAANQHKPELERLRAARDSEHARATRLAQETAALTKRLTAYAATILALTEERDQLRSLLERPTNVQSLPVRAQPTASD